MANSVDGPDVLDRLFFGRDDTEHDFTGRLPRSGFLPTTARDLHAIDHVARARRTDLPDHP